MSYFSYVVWGVLNMYFSCINMISDKFSMKKKFIIFTFLTVVSSIGYLYIQQFVGLIVIPGIMFLIFYFSEHKILNVICAIVGYILTTYINTLALLFYEEITHNKLETIHLRPLDAHVFCALYFTTTYTCTKILGWILHKKLKIGQIFLDKNLLLALVVNLLVFFFLVSFNIAYGNKIGYNRDIISFNGVLFFCAFIVIAILLFFIHNSTLKEQRAKSALKQYENLQAYTTELESLYTQMRTFKHDYINVLSTMGCFIDDGDVPALKEYFSQTILPSGNRFSELDTKLGVLSNIHQLDLKSLFSAKLIYAMGKGIHIEIEIKKPIKNISMEAVDLTRIMGCFLDNAIEAAIYTEEKILTLIIINDEDCINIIIKNSSSPPSFPLNQLTDFGVSSKGEHRGIGLHNVKTILNNYSNIIWDTDYQEPYFIQRIDIYRKNSNRLTCYFPS